MCQCKLWEFCVFLACCVFSVTTFNVDSFNYASYSGVDTSMFGFSMALHKEANNGWLIVGAPEAQSAYQRRVIRGGVVFKCPTDKDEGCQEIPFDTKEHIIDPTTGLLLDNKTEQWFGATVSSSGRAEGSIVACAPRYTWYPRKRARRDPVGTCYVSNALFNQFNEYSPCRTYQWGYHRQGSCQAGFSAAINSAGSRLFIGSPGSWYWQGQMYSIDAHARFTYKPRYFSSTYGAEESQVHQQSLAKRPAVFSTVEGTEKDDDSYMGYSTITGDFLGNGNPDEESIAVGMPRGNNLKGVVLLFTRNLTDIRHFTSDQLGCYFGYALATADVDGDDKVDLIVGSPMYTVANNKNKFDVGRVYVFYHLNQTVNGTFMVNDTIDGFNSRSRFGQALASLGDINQDGYGDFAVGAPYDGKDNRGAVYIYHGSSTGVRKKYSQVIFAEDVVPFPAAALTTFGFSITGGMDLDGNEYPDMAVGAYLSNKAFFFRSRPVIRVDAWVQFLTRNKEINITQPNHALRTAKDVKAVRTEINFCARYYGKGIPDSIDLDLQYILDSKKLLNPRMGFVDYEGQNIRNDSIQLFVNRIRCTNETKRIGVYVRTDIRDKLTALVAEVKYWMKTDVDLHEAYYARTRNPRSQLIPVLDLNSPPSKKDSIRISKNCGVCIPNLNLNVTPSVDEYMLNSDETLELTITVSNTGDDSFETTVEVHYPEGMDYSTSTDVNVVSHVLCTSHENRTIECDIGNPIPRDKTVIFKLGWAPVYDSKVTPSSYDFTVKVNSTNPELPENLRNNVRNISVGILYDYHQELNGVSYTPKLYPNFTQYNTDITKQTRYTPPQDRLPEEVIGPLLIHLYYLTNEGKTTIEETELFFVWPAYTRSDDPQNFLYLLEPPQFSGTEANVQCGPIPANYRDFAVLLNGNKTIWERYHIGEGKISSEQIGSGGTSAAQTGSGSGTDKKIAVSGGGIAKSDENINKAVEQSQDISHIKHLKNKTDSFYWTNQTHYLNSSGIYFIGTGELISEGGGGVVVPESAALKVQIYERRSGSGGSGYFEHRVGNTNYYYRCLRLTNGQEAEEHCRPNFTVANITRLLQQQVTNVHLECTRNINGRTQVVDCTTLFPNNVIPNGSTDAPGKATMKVQIYERQSGTDGSYLGEHRVGNTNFYYRCLRIIDGDEREDDCEPNFTTASINQLLQQQDGNIQWECTRNINGKTEVVDCTNLFPNNVPMESTMKIQIIERQSGGAYLGGHRVGNTNYYYRCLRTINGDEKEINCGTNFTTANITQLLAHQGVNIQSKCTRTINGRIEDVDCATLFPKNVIPTHEEIQEPGSTIPSTMKVRIYESGGSYLGGHRVGNTDYYYRCLQIVNNQEREINCGPNFSTANITGLLWQQGANVQRECTRTINGKSEIVDCGVLFPNHVISAPTVQPNSNIQYRCFILRGSRYDLVDCGSSELLRDGGHSLSKTHRCLQSVSGARETDVPCEEIVRIHQSQRISGHYGSSQNHNTGAGSSQYGSGSQYNQQNNYGYNQQYGGNTHFEQNGGDYGYTTSNLSLYNYGNGNDNHYLYDGNGDGYDATNGFAEDTSRSTTYHQNHRDPNTYGGTRNQANSQNSAFENAGLGRGTFHTGVLGLSTIDEPDVSENNLDWEPIGRDNVATERSAPTRGRRYKRQDVDNHESIAEIRQKYPCNNIECIYMRCTVQNLKHGKQLAIALRGRLNVQALKKLGFQKSMNFSTMMISRVRKLPHQQTPTDQKLVSYEIVTPIEEREPELKSDMVPLWVVVLSAVAGTIILLLLVFLLYKLGFFKRNRPSSAPERQPLNRNGYHHGDEVL